MTNFYKERSRYGTYSTQWDYVQDRFGVSELLPFSISDTDFTIPDGTIKILEEAVQKGFFGYTRWNHEDYKQAIVGWFKKQFNTDVQSEWVVYSPSVIYSLSVFIQLMSKEGDKVLTLTPCYDAFFNCIKVNQRKLLPFSLEKIEGHYEIDFFALENLIKKDKPSIFILCNPHNPTGRVFTENELTKLIELCNKYKIAIISDEIHMDVRRPDKIHLPIFSFLDKIETPVVLLSSPSKTFNSPGLGGSYGMIAEEELRNNFLEILKGRDGLSSIPYLALLGIMNCYNSQDNWVKELNQVIDENFVVLKQLLSTNPKIDFNVPEATYLGWIDLNRIPHSMDKIQQVLIEKEKVAIMRGDTYGQEGKGYIRFNLGAPKSKIIEGAERLLRALEYLDNN